MLLACLSFSLESRAGVPLPDDLQFVPADSLPLRASWYSFTRWGKYPPSPANWCASRDDVQYYYSPSFGANRIIIDDSAVDYPVAAQTATLAPSLPSGPSGPGYGSNDIWLEIQFHSNQLTQVDVILHGATNGVWQILSTPDLTRTNTPWSVLEIAIPDANTNTLYFGPYPSDSPAMFYRAELRTNVFEIVATNLPSAVGVDYHPTQNALILPINYNENDPTFGILNSDAFLTNWSQLRLIDIGCEVRIATVKITGNGFSSGDLFFSSGVPQFTPATIGWLSADGTAAQTNWLTLSDDPNQIEALYIDQTGLWGNDLLAITGADEPESLRSTNLNICRVHSQTETHLITTITAPHLEGALTLPSDTRYGPWSGRLLTADETQGIIYAVAGDGTFTTNTLGIDADTFRLVPTNQDLYCVQFRVTAPGTLLKVPRQFFKRYVNDIVVLQAGLEIVPDDPIIFVLHWNGTDFEKHQIRLYDFFPNDGFFEKLTFAPLDLPPIAE